MTSLLLALLPLIPTSWPAGAPPAPPQDEDSHDDDPHAGHGHGEEGEPGSGDDLEAVETTVELQRCPGDGLQPRVRVDGLGRAHVVYVKGDLAACDLYYVRSRDSGASWSEPLRVNATEGDVDATEVVRGASFDVDSDGRVHVIWVGPKQEDGTGALHYARLAADRSGFEAEVELDTNGVGLTAGGALVVGQDDRVHVYWHGPGETVREDAVGRVYGSTSPAGGEGPPVFSPPRALDNGSWGASETCPVAAGVDPFGRLYVSYRTLRGKARDMRFLVSQDGGDTYKTTFVDNWKRQVCPKTTSELVEGSRRLFATWEGRGDVFYAPIQESSGRIYPPRSPGRAEDPTWRSRPTLATSDVGTTLLVWLEGERDQVPDGLRWLVFHNFRGFGVDRGALEDELPENTLPAAFARPDGTFVVLY